MSPRKPTRLHIAAVLLCGVASAPVFADANAEARLRDQLRQTTLQLRQAEDDNAELKAKVDSMSQQVAASQAPKKAAEASPELRRTVREQAAKLEALQQQLDQAQRNLADWKQGYQQAATVARARDGDAKKFETLYHDLDAHAQSCDAKNARLVGIANDLLLRYKNKGVLESMRDREPLTGLDRVDLEKLAQQYHVEIVDLTVLPLSSGTDSR